MSGVSAAEKYAEVGDARPRCECHKELMMWKMDRRMSAGGRWRCAEKNREWARRWREENPEKGREASRRWHEENLEKNRERARRWYKANLEKKLEASRCHKARHRLLTNLSNHPLLVEKNWPKECKLARLAISGATSHERQAALAALHKSLIRKEKLWLMSLIMSAATRTMPAETKRLLSLESSVAA